MEIYAGSWNSSRIPGQYSYPVMRYNQAPIEPVQAVQPRNAEYLNRISDTLQKISARPNEAPASEFDTVMGTDYESAPFKLRAPSEKGLVLNILG